MLEVAKDPAKLDGPHDKARKEGETWYYDDPIPKDAPGALPSPPELQRNVENGVRAAKAVMHKIVRMKAMAQSIVLSADQTGKGPAAG